MALVDDIGNVIGGVLTGENQPTININGSVDKGTILWLGLALLCAMLIAIIVGLPIALSIYKL